MKRLKSESNRFRLRTYLLIFMLYLTVSDTFAQMSLDKLDYSRVSQKKIRSFVERQRKSGHECFTDLVPKCFAIEDSAEFFKLTTTYIIHGNSDDVWNEYLQIPPSEAYTGRIVGFGFLYSKSEDQIIYKEDKYDKIKVGQLFFFNIKLLGGIRNLSIADEVTGIDEVQKIIRFCYIENGKTEGTQEIHFNTTSDGSTSIIHETWYRSKSRFRDRHLYPFFHKKSVNEFHNTVKNHIENPGYYLSLGK